MTEQQLFNNLQEMMLDQLDVASDREKFKQEWFAMMLSFNSMMRLIGKQPKNEIRLHK